MLHTTGGYLVHAAASFRAMFDYHPGDIHFCTADVGWVTAHTYLIYGPLANGATIVLFEGVPTGPTSPAGGSIIEKYRVNIFYTAPTAIRSLMRRGRSACAPARSLIAESPRLGRRAHQPRSVALVSRRHRRRDAARSSILTGRPKPAACCCVPCPEPRTRQPGSAAKPFFGVRPVLIDDDGASSRVRDRAIFALRIHGRDRRARSFTIASVS